ncbi:hypothetical protein FB45DRAFT_30177 [Roridomyces roridus]|uniref:Cyclin N-terminal domain-containing protein n=1 Tax=Roridomyces roridus TaxID=1738132 RepID=A0AAD7FZ82_9AGAR|nr:hypothetical protein FB45DRAFT_30177 [Roridomyces roridus]
MYSPASSDSSSSSILSYSDWSPSSSKTSSPVHAASLVDPSSHSPALMELIGVKLSRPVIQYLVDCVSDTVEYALMRSGVDISGHRSSKFTSFVSTVLSRAQVSAADVLVTLVYISRARKYLSIALEEWALERAFLGALVVACKYTNDSTLRNVHWALCTGFFGKQDIGRIEREFLEVLDWDLGLTEADILVHYEGIMRAVSGRASLQLAVTNPDPKFASDSSVCSPACPDLDPSSPRSSMDSLCPSTPGPVEVQIPAPRKKHRRLLSLLQSFPLPRHHHHHPVHVVA